MTQEPVWPTKAGPKTDLLGTKDISNFE